MALHPCTQCGRHVRHQEKHCPFCSAALAEMTDDQAPVLRVSRAAMWLGATLAISACDPPSATQSTPTNSAPVNNGAANAPQQLPTTVTNGQGIQRQQGLFPQPQIAPQQDTPQQQIVAQPQPTQPDPNAVPAYGAPAPVRPGDIGSMHARYGVPFAPPQGPNDPGSHARRYGAPAFVEWDEV